MLKTSSEIIMNSVWFTKTVTLKNPAKLLVHKIAFSRQNGSGMRKCSTVSEAQAKRDAYDIVISGGGLVGSAMACALGTSVYLKDKKILLLEGGPPVKLQKNLPEKYSNRVSAISPGSIRMLSDLGVWTHVARCNSVKRMQIWDGLSQSNVSFQQEQLHDDICNIVENHVLLGALSEKLNELNAEVMYKVKVTKYTLPQNPGQLVSVQLQDGTWLQTKLLIGADGFNSLVRQTMGVNYISWNYKQHAIVANLKLAETSVNNVAFQKFLPTGPIGLLPLTNEQSSLVWTVSPSMAESLMAMPDDRFTDELNSALWNTSKPHPIVEKATKSVENFLNFFQPNSGSLVQLPPGILEVIPETRATFPLGLGHAANYVKPSCALIGDAAHRVHPLAGLGVNLGFGDVKSLTESLEKCVRDGNHIGHLQSLREYETDRQRHNVSIMAAIDGLNKLYSTSFLPIVLLRSIGLQIFDAFTPVKKEVIKMASS